MMGIWELASLLLGLLALQYLKQLWSSRNYPPGPFQLPLVGGVWWVRKKFSQDIFIKLAKQYGNIFTIWLGSYPIVILSGYQAVKEGLIVRSEDFAARPVTPTLKALFKKRGSSGWPKLEVLAPKSSGQTFLMKRRSRNLISLDSSQDIN